MKTWRIRKTNEALASKLSETLSLPLPLMKIMVQRGFDTPESIRQFLFSQLDDLSRPFQMPNLGAAVECIEKAMQKKEKIVIYGDYDVDGICSSTLMKEVFSWLDYPVDIYIPSRFKEGYGMNATALEKLYDDGVRFIITVDNGIASAALVEAFQEKGMTFVVTDHHQLPEQLPPCIIVNPLLAPEPQAAYKNLCGCGTAYFLAMGLLIRLAPSLYDDTHRRGVLDLVAVATVADMMPLRADNRILVREGLKVLNDGQRPGLKALCEVSQLKNQITATDIGFRIAPCINACGRIDETENALALLSDDGRQAESLAIKVSQANETRKEIEKKTVETAVKQFENHAGRVHCAIACGENWHKGVLGLAASRLVEQFHCPAIVLTNTTENPDVYSGSARSVAGFHLFEALQKAAPYLEQFGGHAMAAGLSIRGEALADFQSFMDETVANHVSNGDIVDEYWIDDILKFKDINEALYDGLQLLEPCGEQNPQPVFGMMGQSQFETMVIGKQQEHLRLTFHAANEESIQGIAFSKANYPFKEGHRYDFAFQLTENCFRGNCQLQLHIRQIQPSYRTVESTLSATFMDSGNNYLDASQTGMTNQTTFHTKLRGVTYGNRQDVIAMMRVGEPLVFMREYQNSADVNAIACYRQNGEMCGYLSRRIAAQFAPLMDVGGTLSGRVEAITGEGDQTRGLNILVYNEAHDATLSLEQEERRQLSVLEKEELLPMLTEHFLGDEGTLLPIQEKAIHSIIDQQRDTAILMPTGRGKSLIYQLSASVFACKENKMTVVISPLKALIRDQYLSLTNHLMPLGMTVEIGNGDLSENEKALVLQGLEAEKIDVILVTPEFFVRHQGLFLKKKHHIAQIVVDEAHYLMSKRGAYKQLLSLKNQFDHCVWTYLTATVPAAESTHFKEIISSAILYIDDHIRYNLHIVDARHTDNKMLYLYRLLMRDEKTICYVNSRKKAFELARRLREVLPYQLRHLVYYYHGGLPQTVRRDIEQAFKEGHIKLLIATTAFGEGIHISDIRQVVLFHPCFSVESFSQLAGRCARDGAHGGIHLIYGEKDLGLNEKIIGQRAPDRNQLGNMYLSLKKYAKQQNWHFEGKPGEIYEILMALYPDTTKRLWRLALKIFHELDFLTFSENEEQLQLEVFEQPTFRPLEESTAFVESTSEARALALYEKIAFSKDIKALEKMIQTVLCPETWVSEEV